MKGYGVGLQVIYVVFTKKLLRQRIPLPEVLLGFSENFPHWLFKILLKYVRQGSQFALLVKMNTLPSMEGYRMYN